MARTFPHKPVDLLLRFDRSVFVKDNVGNPRRSAPVLRAAVKRLLQLKNRSYLELLGCPEITAGL